MKRTEIVLAPGPGTGPSMSGTGRLLWIRTDWVMEQHAEAAKTPAKLLMNTGPKGDGSIPEDNVYTLPEVGRRLRRS